MASKGKRPKRPATGSPKHKPRTNAHPLRVDYKSICAIDHECVCCSDIKNCCCARYDVCVTDAEIKKIIPLLPEAAKFSPHLKEKYGYANVFEEGEGGLHSIETDEDGLCLFAFRDKGLYRCSLHAAERSLGLPFGSVKPKMCVLWPLTFSEDGRTLTLHDDALFCRHSSLRKKPSNRVSPALAETIEIMTGKTAKLQ